VAVIDVGMIAGVDGEALGFEEEGEVAVGAAEVEDTAGVEMLKKLGVRGREEVRQDVEEAEGAVGIPGEGGLLALERIEAAAEVAARVKKVGQGGHERKSVAWLRWPGCEGFAVAAVASASMWEG